MRKLLSVLFVALSLLCVSLVSALDDTNLAWGTIKVDGDVVDQTSTLAVEEGQTLNIRVGLSAVGLAGASDVEVEAEINGYEYDDYESLRDSTHVFDLAANTIKYVNLEVTLPTKLDKETYWLRLRVLDQNTAALGDVNIKLAVEPARNAIEISDVTFSPSTTLKAGRSLLTTVLLQNYGDKDQNDVKVTVAIPELGVSASEFVDTVATDNHNVEYEDVPEMFLPIPADAKEGEYDVKVTVKYDEYEVATKTFKIKVLANEAYQVSDKLVLAVGPEAQTVAAGTSATYAIALTNAGSASKAYLLEGTAGSDWATLSLSDSLVVLAPGQNKVVYVEAKVAAAATAGSHVASVAIKSGSEVLQTVAFQANVVAAAAPAAIDTSYNLRNGLEIALIVLVVVLVIVGLIVGFSRLKKDDEEGKNYY
ncbi:MAG: hypothetical protein V2A62_04690 [Candidatus Woesearchaeota archaeon]